MAVTSYPVVTCFGIIMCVRHITCMRYMDLKNMNVHPLAVQTFFVKLYIRYPMTVPPNAWYEASIASKIQ